jgi:two-component system, chemotaxis family, sensor kinase CheA
VNPLLEQFLSESRESLQGISEKLMQLEHQPDSELLMTELFRFVHTLKGNSGLFDFPELTRVLHAGEDLMDAVRDGRVAYSLQLADLLLDAMDFVGMLCDEIEKKGSYGASYADDSLGLAQALRRMIGEPAVDAVAATGEDDAPPAPAQGVSELADLSGIPEEVRREAGRLLAEGATLHFLSYCPAEECFFQGDDPFFQARQTPGLVWGGIAARKPWPPLAELDAYSCVLDFQMLSGAPAEELKEYYRYVPEQLTMVPVTPQGLFPDPAAAHLGEPDGTGTEGGCAGLPHEVRDALSVIVAAQREILSLPDDVAWIAGRIRSVAASLQGCLRATGSAGVLPGLQAAADAAVAQLSAAPLLAWLEGHASVAAGGLYLEPALPDCSCAVPTPARDGALPVPGPAAPIASAAASIGSDGSAAAPQPPSSDGEPKFGRRAEDAYTAARSIKVDQEKIDRLMNLIGEMVVAKNALPYLAGRAESVYGVPEFAREIKAQYAVINRIAEEMQDSIMQVRMMPVSFVFQRFPRLVRDTSNRLGKEVSLVLEGEETEADKNIIESLGDPLVHIVRNSLDHGIELPEARIAAGKPAAGTLTIRASQEADRVVIEIRDDGKGIDPAVVKRKAYEKGLIDEERLERMSDQEAVNLVFASGFSTAETVSDLSGRGVGMDVVRTAIEKVNGTVQLESEKGKGTLIRISLPLSMAITNVMIVESNDQIFGVPMDAVVETVRVPRSQIKTIKRSMATVLRGRIVPLKGLNAMLGVGAGQKANDEDELAVLVVSVGDASLGIIVDDFHETVDIILKPMTGVLAGLDAYAGSALLGDGSVLMVLNIKEVV